MAFNIGRNLLWPFRQNRAARERKVHATYDNDKENIAKIVQDLHSADHETIIRGCSMMLTTILLNSTPPFDTFIELNTVPQLVKLLNAHAFPKIQKQAALLLGCMARSCGERKMRIIRYEACPALLMLLDSDDKNVACMAGFALDSIIAGAPHLISDIVPLASSLAARIFGSSFPKNFLNIISSFAHADCGWGSETSLSADIIMTYLPEIKQLLMHRFDGFVLLACGLLDRMLDRLPDRAHAIRKIEHLNIFPRLLEIIATSYNYNLLFVTISLVDRISKSNPHIFFKYDVLSVLQRAAKFDCLVSWDGVQVYQRTLTSLVNAILTEAPKELRNATGCLALFPLPEKAFQQKIHGSIVRFTPPTKNADRLIALCAEADALHLLLDASLRRKEYAYTLEALQFLKKFLYLSKTFNVCESFWANFEEMNLDGPLENMLNLDDKQIRETTIDLIFEYKSWITRKVSQSPKASYCGLPLPIR